MSSQKVLFKDAQFVWCQKFTSGIPFETRREDDGTNQDSQDGKEERKEGKILDKELVFTRAVTEDKREGC